MKILFKTPMGKKWVDAVEALSKRFPDISFALSDSDIVMEMKDADAVVAGELLPEEIRRADNLKVVFVPYAGIDGLPMTEIKKRRIRVANVHENAPFVAERALALALAFYGNIIDYHIDLKQFRWHGYWAGLGVRDTWRSIRGKPCAVIGVGEIGKNIARLLKAFDCSVIGFKKHPIKEPLEHFDAMTLDLWEAIEKSELIFVCLPLTGETRGIFDASILNQMTGKFLVNVGRGEVIQEKAFFDSLKNGILKGAAIDAWYAYPQGERKELQPSKYPFHELPNVILSPHVAGFTPEAASLNIDATVANIQCFLETGHPKFKVDLEAMY